MSETNNNVLSNNYKYQKLIIDGNNYLVGVCKKNDIRQVLITNLTEFYEENLSKEDIVKRCEDLNPLLIDYNAEEIVDDLLVYIPKYTISSTLDCLNLETKIEDGRFYFTIKLTKTSVEHFYENFLQSLYFSFSELNYRYNYLLNIVKKKDEEIAEYKAQGVQILKKSLVTEPFSENLFHTKLKNTQPVDKINIFLDNMKFYDSIKDLEPDTSKIIKQESLIVKPSPDANEDQSHTKALSNKQSIKRPSSSETRCAAAPMSKRKTKVCKQNKDFKYL